MNKKQHWEKVDKDNEYIMERMHPAVMIPGFIIGFKDTWGGKMKWFLLDNLPTIFVILIVTFAMVLVANHAGVL
jgi:hypothetical protein